MMNQSYTPTAILLEDAMKILSQAAQKLEHHDYALAEVMIGVASQILTNAQSDIEKNLSFERRIREHLEMH